MGDFVRFLPGRIDKLRMIRAARDSFEEAWFRV